ncbi:hypothetical protein CERSUDRAFT_96397 [Gelatoporia subvermispora B]|uniref:Uncharacterized protein n=1 Tax=Ceriporiopsis subvermispora (strain B) TaxID=914234 RepID=M2R9Z7_CERS8|nr:hypothetical protein CERSUDRAFT_96397 [Gelatoporia subvermispora B]
MAPRRGWPGASGRASRRPAGALPGFRVGRGASPGVQYLPPSEGPGRRAGGRQRQLTEVEQRLVPHRAHADLGDFECHRFLLAGHAARANAGEREAVVLALTSRSARLLHPAYPRPPVSAPRSPSPRHGPSPATRDRLQHSTEIPRATICGYLHAALIALARAILRARIRATERRK